MYTSEQTYGRIENFLKGRMTPEEKKTFQEDMLKDPQLKEEVEIQKFALEALQMEYLNNVSNLVKERIQKPSAFSKFKWIAGVVFLVTIVGIFTVVHNFKEKNYRRPIGQSDTGTIVEENSNTVNSILDKQGKIDSDDSASIEKKDEAGSDELPSEIRLNTNEISSIEDTVTTNDHSTEVNKRLPEEKVFFKPKETDCSKSHPHPEVRIEPSAYDLHSGKIFVTFPEKNRWKIMIEGINQKYEYKNVFTELEAATYKISVKDTNDCIYNIGNFIVDRSYCNYDKDYVFNLSTDQGWTIPVNSDIAYKVSIVNKAGIEVFGQNAQHGENILWSGFTKSGTKAELGLYKVIINFSDSKTCIYNVVVAE